MKLIKLICPVALTCILSLNSFSQHKVSLLAAEYDENAKTNNLQHLVKYVFENEKMVSREPIVSVLIADEKTKKNNVRFDIGTNKIYHNRYIVTGIGNIIDIKNKKVLLDLHEPFIGFSGDSVIFYTNDIFKGKYYSIYNLKTEKYFKVENANYRPFAVPDIEVNVLVQPFCINHYDAAGNKTTLINDAGYGEVNTENKNKAKQIPPILWIDKTNKNFLYVNFSKDQKTATIYKVGIDKSVEKIVTIDNIPPAATLTYFQFDADGNIIYSCGKGRFLIDIKNKKAESVIYENVGNDFLVESAENPTYGRIIQYKNNEIAKKWCKYNNAQTTSNYIAIENDMVVDTEHYSQGVSVWNSTSNKWTKLKGMFELATIVGWITE